MGKNMAPQLDGSKAGTDRLCSPGPGKEHRRKGVGGQVYFSFVLLIIEITSVSGLFQQVQELSEFRCPELLLPVFL